MVHQYKLNGYNIVIDVYSGAVHVVDDVAYDIIRLFCEKNSLYGQDKHEEEIIGACDYKLWAPNIEDVETEILKKANDGNYPEEAFSGPETFKKEIEECYDDICGLIEEGELFSEDIFGPSAEMLKKRNTDIKALCLHVSHTCDLTCSYCFAGQGRFNGPSSLMTLDVAKRAIDFLIENSGGRFNLEVDFFGGEPLLNFDVVKGTVAYARSIEKSVGKNFRFTLTTNGMGITDEVIDFVNRECHNVVLSLDGRKEIHDRERRTAGNSSTGSYEIIVPKFRRLVAARTAMESEDEHEEIPSWVTRGRDTGNTNYYIRGTFTHYNPDFTEDIYHITELGFTELSMEPVVCGEESRFALTQEDLPFILDQYEKLACEMLKRENIGSIEPGNQPFTFYHYMLDLVHGPCIYKRISGCGSGTEYFAVTPQGELYPCHQFVGDEKYLMGDIWNGITEEKILNEFKMCNIYARKECNDCWAKLYCSGGCAANSYHYSGGILGAYEYGCKIFKKRMECAIMMQVARSHLIER